MEFKLSITVGFTPDTLQAVTSLAAAISGGLTVSNSISNGVSNGAAKTSVAKIAEKAAAAVASTVSEEVKTAVISLEELRKLTVDKANKSTELKGKVKSILASYEVKSVSNLPENKYQEFYTKISEL